jgi:hypothetical protein
MAFDLEAAHTALTETLAAIQSQDAREDDLKRQLAVNRTERARNFLSVAGIYRQAEQAGLTAEAWRALNADLRRDVSRALAAASLEGM